MLILLLTIFVMTAILGGYMLSYIWPEKTPPKRVAIIHGSLGGIGILLLAILSLNHHVFVPSLIIFICVAAGGVFLFSHHKSGKQIPRLIAVGHGIAALIAIGILSYVIFSF